MFMKLEAELLIPVSTIQYIITEMRNIANLRMDVILSTLRKERSTSETSDTEITKLIEMVMKQDPVSSGNAKL